MTSQLQPPEQRARRRICGLREFRRKEIDSRLERAPEIEGYLHRKFIRKPCIIGVDESHQLASRLTKGTVARRINAGMRLGDECYRRAEAFDHEARAVARAVIDHDQLQVAVCLGQHARDGAAYARLSIMNRQDHRDEGTLRPVRLTV